MSVNVTPRTFPDEDAVAAALREAGASANAGRWEEAVKQYHSIVLIDASIADARFGLGLLALQANQPMHALPHLKAALAANPCHGRYWVFYIDALVRAGQQQAAGAMREQGLQRGLSNTTATISAQELSPLLASLDRLFKERQFERMADAAGRITMRDPDCAAAWSAQGAALMQFSPPAALEPLRQALRLNPASSSVMHNLGTLLRMLGRPEAALSAYRRATSLDPRLAEAHAGVGSLLTQMQRYDEAEISLRRAIELRPGFAEAHANLGSNLLAQRKLVEAERHLRQALSGASASATTLNNLGMVLKELEQPDEAIKYFRLAVAADPKFFLAHSNLLLAMLYSTNTSGDDEVREAREFGRSLAAAVGPRFTSWTCEKNPQRLRIGMVSGDLANHPVGFFLERLLANLDATRFEFIAYPTSHRNDEMTARLRPHFSAWRPLADLTDDAAARLIHDDGVHMLIDLAGHTAGNRLPVFAWRPAPVQICWLGYFATTGVEEIDYFLADAISVPVEHDAHFSETVWRLPGSRLCYSPPAIEVELSPPPVLSNGFITFGCFQNLSKVSDPTLAAWAEVMAALPGSRLRLQSWQLGASGVRQKFLARAQRQGIAPDRIDLHGPVDRVGYLRAHAEVDMILDTFPFTGGTTTCDALWMGVPTITFPGVRLIARQGASLLTAAELGEWVAADRAEYVTRAVEYAQDTQRLQHLRQTLRDTLVRSALCDGPLFARRFEEAMWQIWAQAKLEQKPG